MADQNISQILAALASQRPGSNVNAPQQPPPQPPMGQPYQGAYPTPPPPVAASGYALPQPTASGSVDLSSIKPTNAGSVSLAEAVARARGIAAERGAPMDQGRGSRDGGRDGRRGMRRSRSRSRSPQRDSREFRDGYNPYRDERRSSGFGDRPFSPGMGARPLDRLGAVGGGGGGGDPGTETITIESHLVGLIIGRSGENLRRVETETGARVQFLTGPEAAGANRPCKLSGPRPAREHAKAEIARIISDNGKQSNLVPSAVTGFQNPRATGSNSTPVRASSEGEQTQMMVPNRTVGLIIGRGGETIRDLQDRSGCHVNIVGEDKSVQGLRPVNLVGSREQTAIAKELIMQIVDSDSKSQAQARVMQGGPPVMTATGRSDMIGERINDNIIVPSEAVGMIIGKGGETIKEMQNISGCKINVSQPAGQDLERDIGLIGTREAVQRAKDAIMDKVRAVQEKNGSGGRSQPSQYEQYGSANSAYGQNQGGFNQHSYAQYGQQQGSAQPNAQQAGAGGAGPAGQAADPYAAYGGYENYMALWYSHMNQQGQAQGQSGGGQPTA